MQFAHDIWVLPKIRETPQNGWFTLEIPIKMDDLGGKPPIFGNIHVLFVKKSIAFNVLTN